ncbi:hypothetical protein ABZX93_02420 [Streptomyces sp. NPDC006632]|uniref:hypothetical protein n=1 Tax=Streptomyces sp. NPDC006632 TaxID=3157182 RepID=UPI0033BAFC82
MSYNLLAVDSSDPATAALALAGCLGVAVGDVDVGEPDTDPDVRNWNAPVTCGLRPLQGDLTQALDIYVQETVGGRPLESEVAARFAKAVRTTVLFPALEAPPSAYWAATPQGLLTRVRLEPSEDEPPVFTVTAVEARVARFPRATVTRFEEIVREQRPDSPVSEHFMASLERVRQAASCLARLPLDDDTGGPIRSVRDILVVWERVITQMESGWAPSGWYPADLYRERLEARDALAALVHRLPHDVVPLLTDALGRLDRRFAAATVESTTEVLPRRRSAGAVGQGPGGWWWCRRPDPVPWEQA